jgi:hypothetical protein
MKIENKNNLTMRFESGDDFLCLVSGSSGTWRSLAVRRQRQLIATFELDFGGDEKVSVAKG